MYLRYKTSKNPEEKYWCHGTSIKNATTAPDDEVDLTIEDLLNLVQQTVLLVGQTNNTISYHRRLSALAGAMKSSSQNIEACYWNILEKGSLVRTSAIK